MVETDYYVGDKWNKCIAVLADIHDRRYEEFVSLIKKRCVDYIFIPGDLVNGKVIERTVDHSAIIKNANNLLNQLSLIAPTFFSLGNHEKLLHLGERELLKENDVVLLVDEYREIISGLYIGGLSSAKEVGAKNSKPRIDFLNDYEKIEGYKILLCHHPEYYEEYLKHRNFNLIVSGHAHGGQVRVLNHGLYAPGQGFLPKYTSGLHDDKFIISRGIAGTEMFPRINNEPEIVYIHI